MSTGSGWRQDEHQTRWNSSGPANPALGWSACKADKKAYCCFETQILLHYSYWVQLPNGAASMVRSVLGG